MPQRETASPSCRLRACPFQVLLFRSDRCHLQPYPSFWDGTQGSNGLPVKILSSFLRGIFGCCSLSKNCRCAGVDERLQFSISGSGCIKLFFCFFSISKHYLITALSMHLSEFVKNLIPKNFFCSAGAWSCKPLPSGMKDLLRFVRPGTRPQWLPMQGFILIIICKSILYAEGYAVMFWSWIGMKTETV